MDAVKEKAERRERRSLSRSQPRRVRNRVLRITGLMSGIESMNTKERNEVNGEEVMEWIRVTDRLPEIPPGKYGVQVLVAMFDSVYEEINPGRGYAVMQYSYHLTTGRDGSKHKGYEWCELDADFMEFARDGYAYPSGDPITHWMPLPPAPDKKPPSTP